MSSALMVARPVPTLVRMIIRHMELIPAQCGKGVDASGQQGHGFTVGRCPYLLSPSDLIVAPEVLYAGSPKS